MDQPMNQDNDHVTLAADQLPDMLQMGKQIEHVLGILTLR